MSLVRTSPALVRLRNRAATLAAGLSAAVVLCPPVPAQAVVPVVAAAAAAPSCGGERPLKDTGARYTCSFEDDFNGTTLDLSKWFVQATAVTGVKPGPDSCYLDDPDNVSVGNGSLRLTSQVEWPYYCWSPTGPVLASRSAATVGSWNRFTQTYGRFEFRAKLPDTTAPGLHSALWLYPQAHTYGAWPASGEIDVAEWFSAIPGNVYPSVHYAGENPALSSGYDCTVAGVGTGFHRYAVEWTPSVMRFYYDGVLRFTHRWAPAAPLRAPQPFDKPFYLVMTQSFGAEWNSPTAQTPWVGTTTVDWVRVWK